MEEKKDEVNKMPELIISAEKVIAEFGRLSRDAAAVQREPLRRILATTTPPPSTSRSGASRRPHRPGQLPGLRAALHARRRSSPTLHCAHRRRRHLRRRAHRRHARHLHLRPSAPAPRRGSASMKYLLFNDGIFESAMQTYQTCSSGTG
jgi:auxin responsive GH3 family protein/jasmonic acid-amino synthetase